MCTQATEVIVSVAGAMTLGSNTYNQSSLVKITDPTNPTLTNSLYNAMFGTTKDLDAVHVQNDGKILASFTGSGTLTFGGVTFYQGDVIRYDPVAGTSELYLKGNTGATTPTTDIWGNTTGYSVFKTAGGASTSENLSNLDLLSNGHILLSSAATTSYVAYGTGVLAFQDEDVIEFDPVTKKAVGIYFDGTPYYSVQTNAFARLSSTEVLVSTTANVTIGSTTYTPKQIIKIDTSASTASLFMTLPTNIDAITVVPEPATLALLGLGGLLLRRKR